MSENNFEIIRNHLWKELTHDSAMNVHNTIDYEIRGPVIDRMLNRFYPSSTMDVLNYLIDKTREEIYDQYTHQSI